MDGRTAAQDNLESFSARFDMVMTPSMKAAAQLTARTRGMDMSTWLRLLVDAELSRRWGENWGVILAPSDTE